jgi:hypothetical protein
VRSARPIRLGESEVKKSTTALLGTSAEPIPTEANQSDLAADILRGAAAIGAFIGLDERQTFHGLQNGHIPATKEGRVWVSTRSRLRRHYNEGTPPSVVA